MLRLIAPPLCVACGGWAGRADPLCGACRRELTWLSGAHDEADLAWAPVAYAGPARSLVAALKFRGAWRAADAMAAAICAGAPAGWMAPDALLVPAPLHPARLRRRGFNQAEKLASAIARRAGARVWDGLARVGSPATQMGRGRAERLAAMAGTIAMRPSAGSPPPGPVVLVDDVVTTGATLAACAAALRAAGAADEIRAVAYARTPGR